MTERNDKLTNFIQQMPKAEIHIHLEGAIQPKTVLELAKRHKKVDTLPSDTEAGLRRWFSFTDFPHFLKVYLSIQDLIRTADDFALIVYENGADMARAKHPLPGDHRHALHPHKLPGQGAFV